MRHSRSKKRGARALAWTLVLTTTLVCALQQGASALIAPVMPERAAATAAAPDRAADMKTVQGALESKIVRQRLKELGLSDQEIQLKLSKLSDRQLHQVAARARALNPGGDLTIVGVLVLIALVLFIIYLAKRV